MQAACVPFVPEPAQPSPTSHLAKLPPSVDAYDARSDAHAPMPAHRCPHRGHFRSPPPLATHSAPSSLRTGGRLSISYQIVVFYGGLRGAIAVALSTEVTGPHAHIVRSRAAPCHHQLLLDRPLAHATPGTRRRLAVCARRALTARAEHSRRLPTVADGCRSTHERLQIRAATMLIVVFTTFAFGGSTKCLLDRLKVPVGCTDHDDDRGVQPLMAATESQSEQACPEALSPNAGFTAVN